MTKSAVVYDWH